MKGNLAIAVAVLFAGLAAYLFHSSQSERQRFEAELAAARLKNENLAQELAKASRNKPSEAELERLRANQSEALKLRAEVAKLRQEMATAKAAARKMSRDTTTAAGAASTPAMLKLEPLPESNAEIAVHKTETIYGRVAPTNSAILAGGWRGESGRRLFALIRPSQDANAPNQISVDTHWFEVSDDVAQKLRIAGLDTSGNQVMTLADFSIAQFQTEFDKAGGGNFLTSPSMTTLNGRQARISVTENRTTSGGPVEVGPQIDVLPTLTDDGALEIGFRAALVETRNAQPK